MNDRPRDDAEQNTPATAPPAAPAAPAAGGFAWGLTPGVGTTPPVAPVQPVAPAAADPVLPATPASPAPTPPPLVEPSEPAPTVAWTPPAEVAQPAPAAPSAQPAVPASAAPSVQPASWEVPTQLMGIIPSDEAAQVPNSAPEQTSVFAAEPGPSPIPEPAADAEPASALDSLFGEEQFRDYEAEPVVLVPPPTRATTRAERDGKMSRTQKVLLSVAGGLVAVLALVALFLLGTRLPDLIGPAAVTLPSVSPSPSETTPGELPAGPVEPGVWAWNELLGGECLTDSDPWAEEFTVVDCAEPHPAQLVQRGVFPPSDEGVTSDPFPGTEALQGQISLVCSAPGVIDLAVAGQYTDVQLTGSYPVTAEQWDAGIRDYFCFVSRSSGEPLTGSLAVPPPPAEPAEEEPAA